MISQYIGNHNREAEEKSICINFLLMILTGLTFLSVFSLFQNPFVGMFTEEEQVITEGSTYLGIISWRGQHISRDYLMDIHSAGDL